jgi:hypothetical protein
MTLEQPCNKSDCYQFVPNLLQQLGTSSANTTCWQLVNRFVRTCLQTCNNLCVFNYVCTHIKISQLIVNKMCSQQACSKLANKVVTMRLFHQVATRLLLTTCWQIVELQDDNKLLEQLWAQQLCSELSQQAIDNLTRSWKQAMWTHPVDKLLEQHCYKSAAGLLQHVHFYVCTRVKISHLVASLPTSRHQLCSHACAKLSTTQQVNNL